MGEVIKFTVKTVVVCVAILATYGIIQTIENN